MSLNVYVITPERVIWDVTTEEAVIPGMTGKVGVLKGHAPLAVALEVGMLKVRTENGWNAIIILEGFAEVQNDKVMILCQAIEEVDSINPDQARKDLTEAAGFDFGDPKKEPKERIEAYRKLRTAEARVEAIEFIKN